MIFEKLKLNNFGIYQGEHIVHLDSATHNKPIILFGGLNGGGKTTFLDSLQLALYGKHAKCSNRGRLPYGEYLKQAINRYSDEKAASVSLTFRHSKGTDNKKYEIVRSWSDKGNKEIQDSVSVLVDGKIDNLLTDNWDDFVSEFIPQSMSELFFFDGEKIEDLADPTRSAQLIQTGIEALLGLDLLSQLSKDLKAQKQKRQEEDLDSSAAKLVEELGQRLKNLEGNLSSLEGELQKTVDSRQALEDDMKEIELEMQSSGAHLLDSLNEFKAEKKNLETQLEATDSNIIKAATSALPLLMAKELLFATQRQAEVEINASEMKTAQTHIDSHNIALINLLRETKDENTVELVQELMEILKQDNLKKVDSSIHYLDVNPAVFKFAISSLDSEAEECRQLLTHKAELKERIVLVEKKMEAVPDSETVREQLDQKKNVEDLLERNRYHLEATTEEYNQCKQQIAETEARLDATLVQKSAETFEQKRNDQVAEHLSEMKTIIDSFKKQLISENISKLESKIKSKFSQLERKSNLISKIQICPHSFKLTLLGADYNPLDPKRLSAGERQLLSVAILWALADESGKEIPTIIDTPMGRLDGKHRTKLVENYFPQAAGQVILLSTDEEISGPYYKKLKPSIAQEYHISYDETLRTSTIQPGYFGEAV